MRIKGYFREVREADRELLFTWANDAETRRQSFSQEPISREEHAAWFARTQADADCLHWIFMVCGSGGENDGTVRTPDGENDGTARTPDGEHDGTARTPDGENDGTAWTYDGEGGAESVKMRGPAQPAGVLRLAKDHDSGAYRISYSIAPAWRGRGCGSLLLAMAKKWAAAVRLDCTELYGEVRAENAASVRCFEKAGYERAEKESLCTSGLKEADNQNRVRKEQKAPDTERTVRFRTELSRKEMIYFRADANGQAGYGHLMRCLTIAEACEKRGMCPVFVTADGEAQERIAERGFPGLILHTDYRDMESELGGLRKLLAPGALIVLDSYCLTEHYVETLKEHGHRIVWMDDLGEQEYSADMLINYNVYAKQLPYPPDCGAETDLHGNEGKKHACICLLGPSYAPIRPAFRRKKPAVRETVRTVLVTTGGSDPYRAGVWFTKLLTELLPDAAIRVVCGPHAAGKEELYRMEEQNARIAVIEGCNDLSPLMHGCDLAVAAAGSTLYELCAAGLPGILYYMADNQRMGAEAFAQKTGAVNLGDIRSDDFKEKASASLAEALMHLEAAAERGKLADKMHALVDGNGAERIADELAKLVFVPEA